MDGRRRDANYKLLGARAVVKRALLSLVTKYSLSKQKNATYLCVLCLLRVEFSLYYTLLVGAGMGIFSSASLIDKELKLMIYLKK